MSAETAEQTSTVESSLDVLYRWYHVPAIVLVVGFMFWVRMQNYEAYLGETLSLQAIDSWYHWRTTVWTVENYPWVIGFEPWTGFPEGTIPGQFGTIFDFILATVAMVIGLGDPSQAEILAAGLVTVPAMAALVAVPVYYIGAHLGGRAGGVAGIALLALAPGTFLSRTTAGMLQHHVAEVLFMALSVLALLKALQIAEAKRPVWELVTAGDWAVLKRPAAYSALAGLMVTFFIWTWPPGVLIIGIFGLFLVVQLAVDFVRGRSPDHVAFVGIVSLGVVAGVTALRVQEPGFSATGLDYLPPVFALLTGAGAAFMAWLARFWEAQAYDRSGYPLAVGAAIVAALGGMWLLLPDLYSTLVGQITGRLTPFGAALGEGTVQEAVPPEEPAEFFLGEYGLGFYTGILGIVAMLTRPLYGQSLRSRHLFVAVWATILYSMGFAQIRFNYYTVLAVAVVNAYLVGLVVEWADLRGGLDKLRAIETYQVLTLGVVLLLLFVPLLPPVATVTAAEAGQQTAPSPDGEKWGPLNEWMHEETPEVGAYGGADNAEDIEYFGSYDSDFEYPDGSYGVLSWWDYGHLMTVQAERIPHSNPFQQNARSSAAFLTAQDEATAELYLDAIAAGESPTHEAEEAALRDAVEESALDTEIQYIAVSDTIVGSKFNAITQWTGPETAAYDDLDEFTIQNETVTLPTRGEQYENTMASRLYLDDAAGLEHYRLIHETADQSELTSIAFQQQGTWEPVVTNVDIGQSTNPQILNIWQQAQANPQIELYDRSQHPSVKLFERVEGATITGAVDTGANTTVTAAVALETDTNRTTVYTQETTAEDGTFEVTVPYPTAEELGPEDGFANASVRAEGGYGVQAVGDDGLEIVQDVTVTETAVQEGAEIEVELDEPEGPDVPEDEEE